MDYDWRSWRKNIKIINIDLIANAPINKSWWGFLIFYLYVLFYELMTIITRINLIQGIATDTLSAA